MLGGSVESDRLVLLDKGRAAFEAGLHDKAQRIMQRLAAQTEETMAAASGRGSSSTAAPLRSANAVPIVVPASAAPLQTREVGHGFSVPLLAPALHSALSSSSTASSAASSSSSSSSSAAPAAAASSAASSSLLPSASQPPLFLVLNNTGLVHMRAGRNKIGQIFLARALESAEQLLSSLASPAPPSAAPPTPSHARLTLPSSSSRSQLSTSPSTAAAVAAVSADSTSVAATTCMPLYSFLLSKSLEVFYNTGQLLLQMHADSALADAQACSNMAAWERSQSCVALRLAARCFKHCVDQPNSSSYVWSLLTPALSAAASSKILFAHLRLADGLLLLHRCSAVVRTRGSSLHPLLQSAYAVTRERETLPESDVVSAASSSASSSPNDDPYDLHHAVSHLKRALVLLHERQQQQQESSAAAAPSSSAAALSSLVHAATLQLASVLLTLRDASHALQVLSSLPPHQSSPQPAASSSTSSSSSASNSKAAAAAAATAAAAAAVTAVGGSSSGLDSEQRLHADLYAVEAHLLLQNPEDAMRALCASRNPCVRRCVLQCSSELTSDASAAAATAAPSAVDGDLSDDDATINVPLSLHVYSTLAFLFLAQQLPDRSARCVQFGLALDPSHPPLLQLALLQSMRADHKPPHNMHALWMLKRQEPAAAPPLVVA